MNFKKIIEKLQKRLQYPLPGIKSWIEMSSRFREKDLYPPDNPIEYKNAAVLICLIPDKEKKEIIIPFIQRPKEKGPHSNQISLPGGAYEEQDKDYQYTAIRETNEEIGIPEKEIHIIGKLTPLYIPVSRFLVHPYVGYIEYFPEFRIDTNEVETLLLLHLSDFLKPENKSKQWITAHTKWIPIKLFVPVFNIHNHIIWGATAMIMNEFMSVYKDIL
ncbi:MAG: coenzyme A pyrophosphatase [Leptospiraceae bacterium]|nr:MAG: coenzyme A pyrophosphatase [Leptospiraceae bacterium]